MDSQQKDPKDAVPSHEFIYKNQARTMWWTPIFVTIKTIAF